MPNDTLDRRGKPRVQTEFHDESLTVQSDADQADIKKIMKRYTTYGIIDHLNLTEAAFKDVSELGDFADVMRTAQEAEAAFMRLPSKVREIFNHDVAEWLDTAHDQDKRDALVQAGFIQDPEANTQDPTPGAAGGDGTTPAPEDTPS